MNVHGLAAARSVAKSWLRALEAVAPIASHPNRILPTVIDELADVQGERPAILSELESFSYRALAGRASRYARWALAQGVNKGDTVCLLMPNRPEYLAIWLGVTRVGGVVALLNSNLFGPALAHCINIVHARHVIVAAELLEAFGSAHPHLTNQAAVWLHGADDTSLPRIEREIEHYSDSPLSGAELRPIGIADRALCIYTSGTTGLPKAANVSHHRVMIWSHWFAGLIDARADDRMYDCLPMYHSVGGIVAIGAVLVRGGSVLIRERFSTRQFWDDVASWNCTLFQYIGELCRYLVSAEPHPRERAHRLRLACGNGLRPDVWSAFEARFRIPRILEFYAATEANFSLYNVEGEPGAVGRVPPFLIHRQPIALVRVDVDAGELVRDSGGSCIRCRTNEVGEAISQISEGGTSISGRFEGYTDAQDTEKKILRNVFEANDAWFRTGDLMRRDERGFFYFVDRVGDSFRWKGENVATSEVAEAMTDYPGIVEANVYGVVIPGTDGRTGMAAIVTNETFDFADFRAHLASRLPNYARPLFLRVRDVIDVTPTFKHKKSELARESYDPAAITDPIYFNDAARGAFVRMDKALYQLILAGKVRV